MISYVLPHVLHPRRAGKGTSGGGGGGGASCLTPAELAKAGRRAIAVRPQDVRDIMKVKQEASPLFFFKDGCALTCPCPSHLHLPILGCSEVSGGGGNCVSCVS